MLSLRSTVILVLKLWAVTIPSFFLMGIVIGVAQVLMGMPLEQNWP
jgi:hypothetical protein